MNRSLANYDEISVTNLIALSFSNNCVCSGSHSFFYRQVAFRATIPKPRLTTVWQPISSVGRRSFILANVSLVFLLMVLVCWCRWLLGRLVLYCVIILVQCCCCLWRFASFYFFLPGSIRYNYCKSFIF